jgi:integrase
MGKSLAGKELGQGISQRKDGRYQARFTNRFGKRQTIYGKTVNEIRQKLRTEQYEDEKKLNVVNSNMTLDEWFEVWMDTCKKNCRDSTRHNYRMSYNRIKESLGWRKLSGLNLIVMQQAFNELKTDASRKDSRRVLVDILNRAVDADLLNKNIAKQINTVVTKDSEPEEPRVLTQEETDLFLEAASHYRKFNEFSLALETGMRIGEILGLKWSDIDFEHQTIYVNRTLVYAKCDDKADPQYGKWRFDFHDPKTEKGRRKIPMTLKAYQILKKQRFWKSGIESKGRRAPEGYEDLVFVTTKNTPISPRDTTVVMRNISNRIALKHPDFKPLTPHTLRHTFATRCIECGMNPKTLQIILGHSTINITMNLYCHVTEDTLISEMSKFESGTAEQGVNPSDGCQRIRREAPVEVPEGVKVV